MKTLSSFFQVLYHKHTRTILIPITQTLFIPPTTYLLPPTSDAATSNSPKVVGYLSLRIPNLALPYEFVNVVSYFGFTGLNFFDDFAMSCFDSNFDYTSQMVHSNPLTRPLKVPLYITQANLA